MNGTARTALVAVDMQNVFIAPAGGLAVPGADAVVAAVNARVAAAARLGWPVYQATVDLGATAFVHAHPGGDQAALDELSAAGVTLTRSRP